MPSKAITSYTQVKDVTDFNSSSASASPFAKDVTIVSIQETESIVQTLQPFPVHEIGCSPFLRMYAYDVERLTQQANVCAQRQDGDEYVVDSILTHRKLEVLIQTLLAIEAWRVFVLDGDTSDAETNVDVEAEIDGDSKESKIDSKKALIDLIAENKSSLRCAFILHVETTLCSLLNLIMFRKENCDELDNHTAIALVDYCARQMVSSASNVIHTQLL